MKGAAFLEEFGDGTKLYDCTSKGLTSMKGSEGNNKDANGNTSATDGDKKTILRTMMVFTDGADSGSSMKLSEMVLELAHPGFGNFHYMCLVAGSDRSADELMTAFKGVQHAKIIKVTDCSNTSIAAVFGAADKRIREFKKTLVERMVIELNNSSKNAVPCMARVLQQVGRELSNSSGGAASPRVKNIGSIMQIEQNNSAPGNQSPRAQSAKTGNSTTQQGKPASPNSGAATNQSPSNLIKGKKKK